MQIMLDNDIVDIIIERKRIKNMYMRIKENLSLYVSVNKYISDKEIINVLEKNKKSLENMYIRMKRKKQNSKFLCLGDEYSIVFDDNIRKTYINGDKVYTKNMDDLNKYYLKEAKKFLTVRFERQYNLFNDIPDCKLRFRKMSTRWGVNNVRDKIITLNTELYKYDVSLIDYVIIHELCHFKEANHSPKFWIEVSKYYPNYKIARKLLRE